MDCDVFAALAPGYWLAGLYAEWTGYPGQAIVPPYLLGSGSGVETFLVACPYSQWLSQLDAVFTSRDELDGVVGFLAGNCVGEWYLLEYGGQSAKRLEH